MMADAILKRKVKLALKITTDDFDTEIEDLINGALADMGIAGVTTLTTTDALIVRAVVTYARANWGSPSDYDKLKASYDEQKAQLQMSSNYTDF